APSSATAEDRTSSTTSCAGRCAMSSFVLRANRARLRDRGVPLQHLLDTVLLKGAQALADRGLLKLRYRLTSADQTTHRAGGDEQLVHRDAAAEPGIAALLAAFRPGEREAPVAAVGLEPPLEHASGLELGAKTVLVGKGG